MATNVMHARVRVARRLAAVTTVVIDKVRMPVAILDLLAVCEYKNK